MTMIGPRPDLPYPGAAVVAAAINHLLRGAAWARAELLPHSGKAVRVEIFPAGFSLAIREDGTVAPAAAGALPDVTLALSPALLLRLAARDESAWRDVAVSGDAGLAATLDLLAGNLRWDYEEDLSRVVGDIAAHRMSEAVRALHRWGADSAGNLARNFVEYWTEERPLIAAARDITDFNREVDELRDDVARLEKRIEALGCRSRRAPDDA